jgi:hypothetical protein
LFWQKKPTTVPNFYKRRHFFCCDCAQT